MVAARRGRVALARRRASGEAARVEARRGGAGGDAVCRCVRACVWQCVCAVGSRTTAKSVGDIFAVCLDPRYIVDAH